jgi:acetyltransferase
MAACPAPAARQHRLLDGRAVTIRPVRADDAERMREFLASTSEDARYNRFHKWIGAPSSGLLRFLTEVDGDRHVALVCVVAHGGVEELVGDARYVADAAGASGDFGILVKDAWRKSGIAGLLMNALIDAARERGLATIEGEVLADNTPMLRFAHALGFHVEPAADDRTTVRIVRRLAPADARPARSP